MVNRFAFIVTSIRNGKLKSYFVRLKKEKREDNLWKYERTIQS